MRYEIRMVERTKDVSSQRVTHIVDFRDFCSLLPEGLLAENWLAPSNFPGLIYIVSNCIQHRRDIPREDSQVTYLFGCRVAGF